MRLGPIVLIGTNHGPLGDSLIWNILKILFNFFKYFLMYIIVLNYILKFGLNLFFYLFNFFTIFLTFKIIDYNNLEVFMGISNRFTCSHSLLGMLLYSTTKVVFCNLIYD
jgi:hypothetical protein